MAKNPSENQIAPNPPEVTSPAASAAGEAARAASSPTHGTPPGAGASSAEAAARANAGAGGHVVSPVARPVPGPAPAQPRTIPTNVEKGEGVIPDPEQIKPARVMGGLSFPNDHVEPGTTPLTPDHVNPIATPEQRRASMIKSAEEADLDERRRQHAEMRPRVEEQIKQKEAEETKRAEEARLAAATGTVAR